MTGGIGFVSTGKDNDRKNRSYLRHTKEVKAKGKGPRYGTNRKLLFRKRSKRDIAKFLVKFRRQQRKLYLKQIFLLVIIIILVGYILIGVLW
ncbi:MAG: hypothetical protein ABFS32_10025 [Bacteroidota bacterium]